MSNTSGSRVLLVGYGTSSAAKTNLFADRLDVRARKARQVDEFVSEVLNRLHDRQNEELMIGGEGAYEMANVRPERSGLPFVVYISERGNARHAARVKISRGPRAKEFIASVSIEPDVGVVAGNLDAPELELLRQWIALNKTTLLGYWNREIEYTDDALAALKPLK